MKKALILCTALIALAACETVKGAGKDISTGGKVVTETAKNVQKSF